VARPRIADLFRAPDEKYLGFAVTIAQHGGDRSKLLVAAQRRGTMRATAERGPDTTDVDRHGGQSSALFEPERSG
jgi:hypothetical protein